MADEPKAKLRKIISKLENFNVSKSAIAEVEHEGNKNGIKAAKKKMRTNNKAKVS